MANVSNVILAAAIAAVSIATPALAAHEGKPTSAHRNGYIARNGHGNTFHAFASAPRSVDDPAARPYDRTTPFSAGGF
jgi:hypothetical protein